MYEVNKVYNANTHALNIADKTAWQEAEKEEVWLSPMSKTPTFIENPKKQRDNIQTPPKISITQRLRTDVGRTVEVTIATQLVWLNRFTGSQPKRLWN